MSDSLVLSHLARHASEDGGAPALAGPDLGGRMHTLTRGALAGAVHRAAEILAEQGLQPGDRIALFTGNNLEFVLALLGAWQQGAVVLPLNPAYRGHELRHILNDARPRWILAHPDSLELLHAMPPADRGGAEIASLAALAPALAAPAASAVAPAENPTQHALLIYTSGTTGPSKGAMIGHGNIAASVNALRAAWQWQSSDVLLLALPLFHIHGLIVGLLTALSAGASIRLRRFAAPAILDELLAGGPTVFFGVPTFYQRLLDEIRLRGGAADLTPLRLLCSGSAPLSAAVFDEFRERTGQTLLERYGMTEAGMILSNPYDGPRVAGEVGFPLPGVSVRVVNADGSDVVSGQEGELYVAGNNVFAGYWEAPQKTEAAFVTDASGQRWFRTGDWAVQDPERGALTLLGRRDDLILVGGYNVYPLEIEEVLMQQPGVAEAAVHGALHADLGKVPVAYIVPQTGQTLDKAALLAACRAELASFKVPRSFSILPELPRNALGKIQRHRLPPPEPF
jgi:malonyl-CoA/methylmalonyl-CoA synthetase